LGRLDLSGARDPAAGWKPLFPAWSASGCGTARTRTATAFDSIIESDRQEGKRLRVDGTLFSFINGHVIFGSATLGDLERLIDTAVE
jgi:hypothetical protein